MRKLLPLVLLILFTGMGFLVQASGIDFYHDWEEALAAADQEQKPIFLDAYTTWCGPCKWMSAKVFTDEQVADFYNANFINLKLDMEAGYGLEVARMFKVQAYPTLLYLNSQGQIVHRSAGSRPADEFIALGQAALDTEEPLHILYDAYDSGDYDRKTLYRYAMHGSEVSMDVSDAVAEYQKGMAPADLMTEEGWSFFEGAIFDIDGELFTYFKDHMDDFAELYGRETVETKYTENYFRSLMTAVMESDTETVELCARIMDGRGDPETQLYYQFTLLHWIKTTESREAAYQKFNGWINTGRDISPKALDRYAQEVAQAEAIDPQYTDMALAWTALSMEQERTPKNLGIQSQLLWQGGSRDRALTVVEEAIALAKEVGADASGLEADRARMRAEVQD